MFMTSTPQDDLNRPNIDLSETAGEDPDESVAEEQRVTGTEDHASDTVPQDDAQ